MSCTLGSNVLIRLLSSMQDGIFKDSAQLSLPSPPLGTESLVSGSTEGQPEGCMPQGGRGGWNDREDKYIPLNALQLSCHGVGQDQPVSRLDGRPACSSRSCGWRDQMLSCAGPAPPAGAMVVGQSLSPLTPE